MNSIIGPDKSALARAAETVALREKVSAALRRAPRMDLTRPTCATELPGLAPNEPPTPVPDVLGMSKSEYTRWRSSGQLVAWTAKLSRYRERATALAQAPPSTPSAPSTPTADLAALEAEERTLSAGYMQTRTRLLEIQQAKRALQPGK